MNINDVAFASRGAASSKLDIARNVNGKAKESLSEDLAYLAYSRPARKLGIQDSIRPLYYPTKPSKPTIYISSLVN